MNRLNNKVALITGAANGIGKATAQLFLKEGAKLMLVDIDARSLKETVNELNSETVNYIVADVSKKEDTLNYVNKTLEYHGNIDFFFANAGIEGDTCAIRNYPEEVLDKVLAVNIKGVFLGCQYVIPQMNDGGSVVITSSTSGLKGVKGLCPYVASKHAVVGIMRTAALENASRKIRVNAIHPGPVNTRMMRKLESSASPENPSEAKDAFEAAIPLRKYAEPSQIAESVLFLACDESKYITGTSQVIDGGLMCM